MNRCVAAPRSQHKRPCWSSCIHRFAPVEASNTGRSVLLHRPQKCRQRKSQICSSFVPSTGHCCGFRSTRHPSRLVSRRYRFPQTILPKSSPPSSATDPHCCGPRCIPLYSAVPRTASHFRPVDGGHCICNRRLPRGGRRHASQPPSKMMPMLKRPRFPSTPSAKVKPRIISPFITVPHWGVSSFAKSLHGQLGNFEHSIHKEPTP